MLIVLSDGEDSRKDIKISKGGGGVHINKKESHAKMLDLDTPYTKDGASYTNYCTYIHDSLEGKLSRTGSAVSARLAVIGFGDNYESDNNPNLKNCVGAENVFDAQDEDEIYDKLIELIGESIGRLYTPADSGSGNSEDS